MALSYLAPGADYDASRMTALAAELDRKLGLLLDGKSPLMLLRHGLPFASQTAASEGGFATQHPLFGNFFFFLGASPKYVLAGSTTYRHQPFVDAAEAATELARDEARKTMLVTRPSEAEYAAAGVPGTGAFFARSLQAHTRDADGATYFIEEEGTTVPEKRYRLAVAELVFDDWGGTFDVPGVWDKYNFFRIHNLGPHTLTARFLGSSFSVTIPRYECVAIRRDTVAAGYNASLKYFWRHKAGDGRFLQMLAGSAEAWANGYGKEVYGTMAANNVASPQVLMFWLETFSAGVNGVKWHRDPHVVHELGTYEGKFANPSNAGTIIGDVVHHKGELRIYRSDIDAPGYRSIQFDGYATLRGRLQAAGLDLAENATNVAISAPGGSSYSDLLATGTNLLCGGTSGTFAVGWIKSCAAPLALDARYPNAELPQSIDATVTEVSDRYSTVDGNEVLVPVTKTILSRHLASGATAPPAMRIWRDTIGEVLTFKFWGDPALQGSNQDTTHCVFENRRVVLTLFGPEIHFKKRVKLAGRFIDGNFQGEVLGDAMTEIVTDAGGTWAVSKHAISWPPVGWPTPRSLGFFTPVLTRKYSLQPRTVHGGRYTWEHPDIIDQAVAEDGEDFDLESVGESYENSVIAALCPAELETGSEETTFRPVNFGVWKNPDGLFEATTEAFSHGKFINYVRGRNDLRWMPRVFMLAEIYNAIAARINSLKKGEPLWWKHSHGYIEPNDFPVERTDLVPVDQYAAVNADQVNGIAAAVADRSDLQKPLPNTYFEVTFNAGATEGTLRTYGGEGGEVQPGWIMGAEIATVDPQVRHRYLTIAAVRAAAEASGFKFLYVNYARTVGRADFTVTGFGTPRSEPAAGEGFVATAPVPHYIVFSSEQGTQRWRVHSELGLLKKDPKAGDKIYLGFPPTIRVPATVNGLVAAHFRDWTIARTIWAPRKALLMTWFSSGITNETKAILIPESYWEHSTTDFSGASMANFALASAIGEGALPRIGVESAEAASVVAGGNGNKAVPAAHGMDALYVKSSLVVNLA